MNAKCVALEAIKINVTLLLLLIIFVFLLGVKNQEGI